MAKGFEKGENGGLLQEPFFGMRDPSHRLRQSRKRPTKRVISLEVVRVLTEDDRNMLISLIATTCKVALRAIAKDGGDQFGNTGRETGSSDDARFCWHGCDEKVQPAFRRYFSATVTRLLGRIGTGRREG